jgi:hypothetical protein
MQAAVEEASIAEKDDAGKFLLKSIIIWWLGIQAS